MNQNKNHLDLIKKIKTLMVIRLVIVTVVLVAGVLVLQIDKVPFYSIIAIFYLVTLFYSLLLRFRFPIHILAYIQVIIDIILETVIIHYTGGAGSIFAFLYAPSIVAAGIIVSANAAKMIAGISSAFYALLSLLEFYGIIIPVPETNLIYSGGLRLILFLVCFRIIVLCLIGYLSSYLTNKLHQETRALSRLKTLTDFVLNNISSGVITLDSSGCVIYMNPTARDVLKVKEKDLSGIYWPKLFWENPNEKIEEDFIKKAKNQKGIEIEINKLENEKLTLNCNYSQLYDETNNSTGAVITFRNLTILKELELIAKPFAIGELNEIVKRALENKRIIEKESIYSKDFSAKYSFGNIIGKSRSMQHVYNMIEKVARTDSTVLIYGESGTGKELVARAIHYHSSRKEKPFVAINCGGLPESLLESELFGHVKGSFTGAINDKMGLFQVANGGTIFLDEISATSSAIQVKLLRAIQEKEIKKVGDTKDILVDVRILAATNKKLDEEITQGNFREDLYYRLSVIPIELPLLKDRKEDIPLLIKHFINKCGKSGNIKEISQEVMDLFLTYDWPGNVRELENVIERAVTLCEGNKILPSDLPENLLHTLDFDYKSVDATLKEVMKKEEKSYINMVIKKASGDKKAAAKLLGIDLATLYRKLSS